MVRSGELFVVPSERHVERLAREGRQAETRTSLRARLTTALLPEITFVARRECRLILAMALIDAEGAASGQLALFAEPSPLRPSKGDDLLATVRVQGGSSWARTVGAVDEAIGLLRARGATADHLDRVTRAKVTPLLAMRARALAAAMRALDARLERAGARDDRLAPALLAEAIAASSAETLEEVLGASSLRARWLLAWEPSDLAWWRALDDKLAPHGGGARVILPSFDKRLEGTRERDPLEILADEIAPLLDAPAESEAIAPILGDLSFGATEAGPHDPARVRILRASDAVAQARAAARLVVEALARGAAVERVAVALPILDDRTLEPLRRALEEAKIVTYESRGPSPSRAPVVAAALLAIEAALSLDRRAVARLLRSGFVEPARIAEDGEERRDVERRIARLAKVLETTSTAAGPDPVERFVRTAAAEGALASRLAEVFSPVRAAATRGERVRSVRTLWLSLGLGARAGRGGLASFGSDEPPEGVPRAERLAIARDARAWDALLAAFDLYETTAHRARALDQSVEPEAFRLEILDLVEHAMMQPGAGRAAAVRIGRLAELAGDALDLLVVLDVNEGVLPRDGAQDALLSPSVAEALSRASAGAFVAPASGSSRARELAALAVASADAASVVLVFAREDGAGAPLEPSPIVSALERAGVAVVAAAEGAAEAFAPAVVLGRRIAREREREGFFLDPTRPRSAIVGDLAPAAAAAARRVQETGGGERPLAVTGLERFARCAFMGYAHVVLAAREAEHREELPDAREEGTLVHEALAAAFVATRELWSRRPRDGEAIAARGEAAAEVVFEKWQGHAPLRALVRLRARDAIRAVLRAAIADEAWDFLMAEQAFGSRAAAAWPSLSLSRDVLSLALRGTIDRVDRAHGGPMHRVVDYKRSKSTVRDASTALGETALQVPLYASKVSRELGGEATGTYAPTQARDVVVEAKRNAKLEAHMSALLARGPDGITEVERRALDLVARVRGGALAPIPADESECRYCAVSGGCRKPRFAMAPLDEPEEQS